MERGEDITRRLHHPEEEIRRKTIENLAQQRGGEILALLSEALGDTSWRVRKTAADIFSKYPDREASITALVNALYDSENAGRRTSAIEALVQIGDEAIDYLVKAFQTYDEDVRKFVVDILGEIRGQKAIPCLLKALDDQNENVRLAAVEALGKVGGDFAYGKLLDMVNFGPDLSTRFAALQILGKAGKPLPEDTLKRLVNERIFRRAVYEVLGETIPDSFSVQYLLEGISESAKSARQSAVRSLAKIYESGNPTFKEQIEQGLKTVLNGEALGKVLEFLDGDHYHTKRAVIKLVGVIENEKALEALFKLALDDSLGDELAKVFKNLYQRRSDWFRRVLGRQSEEVKLVVRKLIQEEEQFGIKLEAKEEEFSDEYFNRIRKHLSASYGISFDPEVKYLVERRVRQRMKRHSLQRFFEYLALLEDGSNGFEELYQLANLLVTNETYFFREEFQLKTFQDEIMPELIESAHRREQGTIKIWSAGCSSGEEPYTIAMLLSERKDLNGLEVELYGSDLSEEMIEKAKKGIYGPSAFRAIDRFYFDRYFTQVGNKYQLQERIRKMVQFDVLNLLSFNYPPYLRDLDAIFCRNVLIYFSLEAKRALIERFYQVLGSGGFLLLGHSESLMNLSTAFQLRHFKHDLVYQKPALEERVWKRI